MTHSIQADPGQTLSLHSPGVILLGVAQRAKQARLHLGWTQETLANRAQISLGTLKSFERHGKASFATVVLIALALGAEAQFAALFHEAPPMSIQDVVAKPARQRGSRR